MELGMGELVVVLVVALLLFGPKKLPQLGDALGKGIRNFKRASAGADEPANEQPALAASASDSASAPAPARLLPP